MPEPQSNFDEILALANKLKQVKPLHLKPSHPPNLTTRQKRQRTALLNLDLKLTLLKDKLHALYLSKRLFFTHDEEYDKAVNPAHRQEILKGNIPSHLLKEIKKVKQAIVQLKRRAKLYDQGLRAIDKPSYQPGSIIFPNRSCDEYIVFKAIIRNDHDMLHNFQDARTGQLPRHMTQDRKEAYSRLKYILNETLANNPVHLSANDGKWIIRRMENYAKKLERERTMNYNLPQERAAHLTNENYRREFIGVKYQGYSLEEILNPRDTRRLVEWCWGCQLREDERNHLIKVTLTLRNQFNEIFKITKNP